MYSRRLLCWAVFLAFCFLLGGLKNAQNSRFVADQDRMLAEVKELQDRDKRETLLAFEEMKELLSESGRDPDDLAWSKEELEQRLPGKPQLRLLENPDDPTKKTAEWRHPTASIKAQFRFNQSNRLNGWGMSNAPPRLQITPVSRATFEDAGEQLRLGIGKYGRWLWPVVLVVWVFARSRRQVIGDWLLAIAISFTVADAVAPNYTLPDIFSNDIVFIDAVLLAISCATVTVTSQPLRSFVSRRVLSRQFSIRWMMGVTALIAVLVFFGWYGKVVGSVLAVAAMAYGLMALIHRRPPDSQVS